MSCITRVGIISTILKTGKKTMALPCNFTKSNTLPWMFLRFLNCTNGTKSRNASQILLQLPDYPRCTQETYYTSTTIRLLIDNGFQMSIIVAKNPILNASNSLNPLLSNKTSYFIELCYFIILKNMQNDIFYIRMNHLFTNTKNSKFFCR